MNKKCNKCKLEKSLSEFHKNKWQVDGYAHYCKVCKATKAKEYREANPTIEKERKAQWYQNNKEYADTKTKTWAAKNVNKRKKIALNYYYSNKEYCFAQSAKHRAKKLQAYPAWANSKEITKIYKQARELTKQTGTLYVVDHVVPLNSKLVCGLHTEANLQILDAFTNQSKGNRYWPDMP